MEGCRNLCSPRVVNCEGGGWITGRACISELRGSSGRGGYRDLDGGSLALLFGALRWSTISKKSVDATLLSIWVTGLIPVGIRGDNGADKSTIGPLVSFGGEVSITSVNRVGTGMSRFPVDG